MSGTHELRRPPCPIRQNRRDLRFIRMEPNVRFNGKFVWGQIVWRRIRKSREQRTFVLMVG